MATEHDLDTDSWRIYDYVTRHFLGSVSGDCVYRRTKASFSCAGESFTATGTAPVRPGFTAVMPWRVSRHAMMSKSSILSVSCMTAYGHQCCLPKASAFGYILAVFITH